MRKVQPQSIFLGVILFFGIHFLSEGQTYLFDEGDSLAFDDSWKSFPMEVEYLPHHLNHHFGLEKVSFTIAHYQVGELQVRLRSPWGQVINLVDQQPHEGPHFFETVVGNKNFPPIELHHPPYEGTYRSKQNLAHFNKGHSGNGTWALEVRDVVQNAIHGHLQRWSITFSYEPAQPHHFELSNLPVLVVSTGNNIIPDEPKALAYLQILARADGQPNVLSDTSILPSIRIGIEKRGSSSQFFPKKSYSIEIRNKLGEDSAASLLGMPAESDWALIANFSDKSFLRNALTYEMARAMGHYAPRTRFVELVIDGDYQGLYVLTERIKRDANRVDIAKLKPTDTTGNSLTGGYIIKIDKQTGSFNPFFDSEYVPNSNAQGQIVRFQIEYPKADDLHPKQLAYIKNYLHQFESVLLDTFFADPIHGYRKFIDVQSFIDYFLISEWSRNVDAYRISTFLHKPKINPGDGKLKMGPVWDYDIAWFNANSCGGNELEGWAYEFPYLCPEDLGQPPFWWEKFREDPEFNRQMACRWKELTETIFGQVDRNILIDSLKNQIMQAQARNFEVWPILGVPIWPNPTPVPETFEEEVQRLKAWIHVRKSWMDNQLLPLCITSGFQAAASQNWLLFPNPGSENVRVEGLPNDGFLVAYNLLGTEVEKLPIKFGQINVSALKPGIYVLRHSLFPQKSTRFIKE